MAFTFTSLPLNFYTSVSRGGCGFGFEQKYWRIDGFGQKKAWIRGLAYPYSPPPPLHNHHMECHRNVEQMVWEGLH